MGSKGFGLDSHIRLRGSQNRLRGSQQGVELGSHNRLRGSQDKPLARFSYAACAVLKSHMPLARFSMCRLRGSQCAACAVLTCRLRGSQCAARAVLTCRLRGSQPRGGRATGYGLRAREQHRAAWVVGAEKRARRMKKKKKKRLTPP